ncbi:MAG: hypothetical protein ACI9SE_002251 [Neolewinella sp.]|jgi:hypothetical protein
MRIAAALIVVMFTSLVTAQAGKWPDVALNGRIINVMHHGVPAAEVWVTDNADQTVARTFGDGDGYYQLRQLPPGALRVHASGDGVVTASMQVKAGGLVLEATLTLVDAMPLHGIVTLADGTPVPGADVIVYDVQPFPEPFSWTGETTTDADGVWRFEAAPLRPLKARAFVAGLHLGVQLTPRMHAEAVKIVMPAKRTKARIVTVVGVPAGVPVFVNCRPGTYTKVTGGPLPRGAREVAVAADGTAKVWTLAMHHEVRVSAKGHRSMPIAIPCAEGVDRQLQFTLSALPKAVTAPSTTIRGHVVDSLGTPLANITVVAREHEHRGTPAVTAADGSFVIDVPANENVLYSIGLLSAKWRLGDSRCTVGIDGITWQSKAVEAGKPVRLHATNAGNVRGTLIGPNGTPLAAARVTLMRTSKPVSLASATDAAGRIYFSGIPVGSYKLTVQTADGHIGTTSLEVFADQEATLGKLKFAAGSELRGQITDDFGKPVASIPVMLVKSGQRLPLHLNYQVSLRRTSRFAITDRQGHYRLPMVTEGNWYAILIAPTKNPRNQDYDGFTMATAPVTIDLRLK